MGTAPPTRGPARRDARLHAEGRNGERVLTDGDLEELSSVIRFELVTANRFRFFARAIWLLILCALVWLLTAAVTGPLFAYPWSN